MKSLFCFVFSFSTLFGHSNAAPTVKRKCLSILICRENRNSCKIYDIQNLLMN